MACERCDGTGFLITRRDDGREFAQPCSCRRGGASGGASPDTLLRVARIPPRYEHCTLANFEPGTSALKSALEKTMTYCTDINEVRAPQKPVTSLFSWILDFFHIRERRRIALEDMQRLSDRELHDIGVNRRDIAAIVDREIGKLRLDEFRSR